MESTQSPRCGSQEVEGAAAAAGDRLLSRAEVLSLYAQGECEAEQLLPHAMRLLSDAASFAAPSGMTMSDDDWVQMPRELTAGWALYAQGAVMDRGWSMEECFAARYGELIRVTEAARRKWLADRAEAASPLDADERAELIRLRAAVSSDATASRPGLGLDVAQMTIGDPRWPVQLAPTRINRVYIAGPMTGLPDHNMPAFHAEAARLRGLGYTVLNPADHGIVDGAQWADYLRCDLAAVASCEAIRLLPGWSKSKGARLEFVVAVALGMRISLHPDAEQPGDALETAFRSTAAIATAPELAREAIEAAILSTLDPNALRPGPLVSEAIDRLGAVEHAPRIPVENKHG